MRWVADCWECDSSILGRTQEEVIEEMTHHLLEKHAKRLEVLCDPRTPEEFAVLCAGAMSKLTE